VLLASSLRKAYHDVVALDDLSLSVAEGEVCCLLGANGSGKTTTLHALLGLVVPSSGTVAVAGIDVTGHPGALGADVAYVPARVHLYPELSGAENLAYLLRVATGRRATIGELHDHLAAVGFPGEAAGRRAGTYSTGTRQKVILALAFATGARALLLDEPTSGLDPAAIEDLAALLDRARRGGAAVLLATHDLFFAGQVATHIAVMRRGRVVHTLAGEEIRRADLAAIYREVMTR